MGPVIRILMFLVMSPAILAGFIYEFVDNSFYAGKSIARDLGLAIHRWR